jgi:GNAT superfamily N-acetyltransferase
VGASQKQWQQAELMQNSVLVRRATEADAQSVAHLSGELGYAAASEVMRDRLHKVLASDADLLIVAVDATHEVVGWLQAHAAHVVETGFRVEILGLVVADKIRRRGVGRLLVKEAESWAKSLSADAVVVRTNAKRAESHPFYLALGYTTTKTQVVYRKALRQSPP